MHRSGTSLAARAAQLLGVSLGDPDRLMGPGPDNPAGYYENRYIKELDDELLSQLGGAWDHPPVLDPGWEHDPALDALRSQAAALLASTFEPSAPVIGWKDPRCSLLLPFWRSVAPITTTIVVVRDPREVADSLHTRNGMDLAHAALLWLRYLLAAVRNDPSHLIVRQRDFFVDLQGTLRRISAHCALPPPTPEIEAEVASNVDPALRHHVARSDAPRNPLAALALEVWNDGDVRAGAVPAGIGDAIAYGWIRAPVDNEALVRARAEVVHLTERLRRRARERKAAAAAQEQ